MSIKIFKQCAIFLLACNVFCAENTLELKNVINGTKKTTPPQVRVVAIADNPLVNGVLTENTQVLSSTTQISNIPKIKGIAFLAPCRAVADPQNVSNVIIDDRLFVPKPKNFIYRLSGFLGEPLNTDVIDEIVRDAECYYHNEGFPLVTVKPLAGQDITDGILQMTVIVAKVGKVRVEGARHCSAQKLESYIRTKKGQPIKSDDMLCDLLWINDNPFRATDLLYEKGELLGETDLILQVNDRPCFRPYIGYQNTGNEIAGRDRYLLGFNWGNVFGLDHQLNYQIITANHPKKLWQMSGYYIAPLPWRDYFKVFGGYIHSDPKDPQTAVHVEGKSWQISGRYEIPFVKKGVKHNVIFGYDFKRTNNFLEFRPFEETVYMTYIDVSQFLIGYEGLERDSLGSTVFGFNLFLSPGNMTAFNKDDNFKLQRHGADADYAYIYMKADRTTLLWKKWSWVAGIGVQITSAKLLPSEELSIAGYSAVRGYKENAYIGDRGILIRNEIRTPKANLTLNCHNFGDLQFLAFADYGFLNDIDPGDVGHKARHLASIGPGVRYNWSNYVNLRFDWGFQLVTPFERHHKTSRIHFGVVLGY